MNVFDEGTTRCMAALVFRAVLTLAAVSAPVGCDAERSLFGTYTFESSSIVSTGRGAGPCSVPLLPSDEFDAEYRFGEGMDGRYEVTELATGCTFAALSNAGVVSAHEVECDIPPDSPPREQWGLRRRRYVSFMLDADRGLLHATMETWQELSSGDGHSCGIVEGRLVDYQEATK
jgi:hypothetical protein